jgi:CRISPR-associated endonuclease/helicase Cas3
MVFWAKTLNGERGISVRDHCLNVGHVAHALLGRLAPAVVPLVPNGAATLAALHDVGKISPGFQAKCDRWIELNNLEKEAARLKMGCETDHAKVSQLAMQQVLGDEDLFSLAVVVGADHGVIKGARITKNKLNGSVGDESWNRARLALADEMVSHFGPLACSAPKRCRTLVDRRPDYGRRLDRIR